MILKIKLLFQKKRNFYKININEDKERVEIISAKPNLLKIQKIL